ncbi:MAG: hypothetical protein AB1403_02435 [Candidatus Riflebacteria bacterium]
METGSCEKIIDQFIDTGKINTEVQIHINSCPECQATIKKLELIESGPPPTHTIGNSASLLEKFSASAATSSSALLLKAVIAIAVSGSIAAAIFSGIGKIAETQTPEGSTEPPISQNRPQKLTVSDETPVIGHGSSPQPFSGNSQSKNATSGGQIDYKSSSDPGSQIDNKTLVNPSPTEEIP